jgi:hypothetical protein
VFELGTTGILILTLILNLNGIDILSRYSSSFTVKRETNI